MTESVYNIIQAEPEIAPRGPRYQSLRKGKDIPPTYSTFGTHGTSVVVGNVGGYTGTDVPCAHAAKKPTGSFGKIVGNTITPESYLKMTGNRGVQPGNETGFDRQVVTERRPPVPKKDEKPVMGLRSDKNFVVANAVESTLAAPKKKNPPPQPRGVDRATFGKVPKYIESRKEELAASKRMIANGIAAEAREAEMFHELLPSELKELRNGLQARWDTLNREFQTMGFQVETRSKKRRQEQLEAELRSVEAAINKVKRDYVYIFEDHKL